MSIAVRNRVLASFGLICFISAIFNQWAYRNVMPIKDPRRRRIVLVVTGIAFFIVTIVIVSILYFLAIFESPHAGSPLPMSHRSSPSIASQVFQTFFEPTRFLVSGSSVFPATRPHCFI